MVRHTITLSSPDLTQKLGRVLAPFLGVGSVVLLSGDIGAGKTLFCREIIQTRLRNIDAFEDVPSPTFTIVQTYDLGPTEIWHTDLYRLSTPDEIIELGIEDAFSNAIVLVEWPDRLGTLKPDNALSLTFEIASEEVRNLHLDWSDLKWDSAIKSVIEQFEKT